MMDSIQGLNLKRKLVLKQQEMSEVIYPLLISYFAWLRKINARLSPADIAHQGQQRNSELAFLCKHNLLFFLLITKQWYTLEKLFKTQSSRAKLRHLMALMSKKRYKAKKRREQLRLFKEKLKNIKRENKYITKENPIHCTRPFAFFSTRHSQVEHLRFTPNTIHSTQIRS